MEWNYRETSRHVHQGRVSSGPTSGNTCWLAHSHVPHLALTGGQRQALESLRSKSARQRQTEGASETSADRTGLVILRSGPCLGWLLSAFDCAAGMGSRDVMQCATSAIRINLRQVSTKE